MVGYIIAPQEINVTSLFDDRSQSFNHNACVIIAAHIYGIDSFQQLYMFNNKI